jgi:hypothetical protein
MQPPLAASTITRGSAFPYTRLPSEHDAFHQGLPAVVN